MKCKGIWEIVANQVRHGGRGKSDFMTLHYGEAEMLADELMQHKLRSDEGLRVARTAAVNITDRMALMDVSDNDDMEEGEAGNDW